MRGSARLTAAPPAATPPTATHRLAVIAAAATALLLLLPAAATAKGPGALRISGEALPAPIDLDLDGGSGEPGSGGQLARVAEHSGLFTAMFGAGPALAERRPDGDLGAVLTMTWTIPTGQGDDLVVQHLYPWAEGGPVTYTAAGQAAFMGETAGGWHAGGSGLAAALQDAGVPERAPERSGITRGAVGVGGMIAIGLLVLAVQRASRRRVARTAPA